GICRSRWVYSKLHDARRGARGRPPPARRRGRGPSRPWRRGSGRGGRRRSRPRRGRAGRGEGGRRLRTWPQRGAEGAKKNKPEGGRKKGRSPEGDRPKRGEGVWSLTDGWFSTRA